MKILVLFSLSFLVISSCSEGIPSQHSQSWQLVYQNDFNGRPLNGSVKELIDAMKRGSPVRVSWGGTESDGSTWIEFAEPVFTTVMNDSAVVVQFSLSLIQTHYTDPKRTHPPAGGQSCPPRETTINFIMI